MRRPWVRRNYEGRLWAWLPYRGVSNRAWLKEELGQIHPTWNEQERRYEIARKHLRPLVEALAARFGDVDVYLEFSTTKRCDKRCRNATGDDCTCSCKGEDHGGSVYWKDWIEVGEHTLVSNVGRVERHYLVRGQDLE